MHVIADGNPDQQKIGAFGVGFYSVFSITDGPVVKSGAKKVRFHWGGPEQKKVHSRAFHRV
jgi:HSP90 family molecular chaperone